MTRGTYFPDELEARLLRAGLLEPAPALQAWTEFCERVGDIEALDDSSYRLFPLVAANLGQSPTRPAHFEYLQSVLKHSWARAQNQIAGWMPALKILERHKIDFLVFKGLALASAYYQNTGCRPMIDAALLIHPEDLALVWRLLVENGYTPLSTSRPENQDLLRFGHRVTFVNQARQPLHLHWHLLKGDRHEAAEDRFWNNAVPLELPGLKARTLCPADHFLQVCIERMDLTYALPIISLIDTGRIQRHALDGAYLEIQAHDFNQTSAVREIMILHDQLGLADTASVRLKTWRELPVRGVERLEIANQKQRPVRRASLKQHALTYLRLHQDQGPVAFCKNFMPYARHLDDQKGLLRRLALLGYILVWRIRIKFSA